MLSLPQKIDDKTKEVRGETACETVAMLLTLAVTNLEIEQLNFTFLERYLSAQSH
jgi:hypothetical protein